MDQAAREYLLTDDSDEAMDLRFEVFMDELEAHAGPAFGHGRMPEINTAAQALIAALEAHFLRSKDVPQGEVWQLEEECS